MFEFESLHESTIHTLVQRCVHRMCHTCGCWVTHPPGDIIIHVLASFTLVLFGGVSLDVERSTGASSVIRNGPLLNHLDVTKLVTGEPRKLLLT
jgi:hypothetical protein